MWDITCKYQCLVFFLFTFSIKLYQTLFNEDFFIQATLKSSDISSEISNSEISNEMSDSPS